MSVWTEVADRLNTLYQMVSDVEGGGEPGPPGWVYRGAYNNATTYAARDVVRSVEGRLFSALQGNTGTTPPATAADSATWQLVLDKAQDGAAGVSGTSVASGLQKPGVASNTAPPQQLASAGTITGSEARVDHRGGNVAMTGIEIDYTNSYVASGLETSGPTPVTVRAAIEYPSGTFTPAYSRDGARDVVVAPGDTVTLRAFVNIPAGQVFFSRTFATIPSNAGRLPTYGPMLATGTYGVTSATPSDHTTSASGEPTGVGNAFTPSAIRAIGLDGKVLALAGVGDSIMAGIGDANQMRGWMGMSCDNLIPLQRVAYPGDKASNFATLAGRARRQGLIVGSNVMICGYGNNDVYTGRTLAQIQDDLKVIWAFGRQLGMKVVQTTITPKSNSTDSWATVANQTVPSASVEAIRVQLNTWIRTTPSGIVNYVDMADAVESGRNSGLWAAAPAKTADGLHPNAAGHTLMSNKFNESVSALRALVA